MMLRLLFLTLFFTAAPGALAGPGVILITMDGLGWGDLSASGNTQVQTPRLDKLMAQSAVFRDFHVSPLDVPSRAALVTGLYPAKAGVWGNQGGRNQLAPGLLTVSSHFAGAGYATALFGTWGLGDHHPTRAADQGYGLVLTHPGDRPGGVADFLTTRSEERPWLLNGEVTARKGTDVSICFNAALGFIEKNAAQPFLCHLSPSLPALMPETALLPYLNRPGIPDPRRAAWIAELDAATGDLLDQLDSLRIAGGTVVILTSTSGTPATTGKAGFNAGRRGSRGSPYEGGHCVPLFIRWPEGGLTAGNITTPAAHIDLLPTVAALTSTALPPGYKPDGISLLPLLKGPAASPPAERILFTDAQEIPVPVQWRQSCVISGPWRLVNGRELYDLRTDPGERRNIAAANTNEVKRLTAAGDAWWAGLGLAGRGQVRITAGGPQDSVLLTPHEWVSRGTPLLSQEEILNGTPANGQWLLHVATEGNYDILLRRWPAAMNRPIQDGFFVPEKARVRIGTVDESRTVTADSKVVSFRIALKPGPVALQTWFTAEGKSSGAYFVEVRRSVETRPPQVVKDPVKSAPKAPKKPAPNPAPTAPVRANSVR